MANLPTIPLPKGFAGTVLSPGNCLDCGDYATLYLFTGYIDGPKVGDGPVTLLVHQGKACGGFRKRFAAPDDDSPGVTPACDEQGTFVGDVPMSVNRDVPPTAKVLPPGSATAAIGNPLRRRQTDGDDNKGG